MNQNKKSMLLPRVILVLLVIGVIGSYFYFDAGRFFNIEALREHRQALSQYVDNNVLLAMAIFFIAYVLMAALSIPGAGIMTLAGGAIFGLASGMLLVSFASSIGALLAFWGARFLFRDFVTDKFGDRLKSIEKGIEKDGAFYLLTLRLVPAVPFFVVNLLMGITRIKSLTYYVISQLGMLPGTLAYVYAGTQLARIEKISDVVSPGLLAAFAIIGLLPILLRKASNYLSTRRVYKGHKKPKRFDYNLIVIGAGSAGLVSAYIGAAVKAKVALIEKHKMGGDCLNTGCVPSKALIRSAKLLHETKHADDLGLNSVEMKFQFKNVMQRVKEVIGKIEPHDSIERYQSLGVECIHGNAMLLSPWEVDVDGKRLTARTIIVATGARPLVPKIPGLSDVEYLTSDSLWQLEELPKKLVVLGGGPIGCELSQSFTRFGAQVTQVEMLPRILAREDVDVSEQIQKRFEAEGIHVAANHKALRVEKSGDGGLLICENNGQEVQFKFDKLLLALGRKPNIEGFGLDKLGVRIAAKGTIEANEKLQTNFPNIYVCGDVAGPYQFTHTASHQAWYASVNGLLAPFYSFNTDYRVIPWATFTDPEVARVGLSEQEAKEQNIPYEVTRYELDDLDRAITDGHDYGFVKVITASGKDRILGAVIVGAHAGDLLAEFVLAMKYNIGLNKILGTIHTYPTMAEANKFTAGVWKRAHAPQTLLNMAQRYFAWQIA